jgi:hypothetical protein
VEDEDEGEPHHQGRHERQGMQDERDGGHGTWTQGAVRSERERTGGLYGSFRDRTGVAPWPCPGDATMQ